MNWPKVFAKMLPVITHKSPYRYLKLIILSGSSKTTKSLSFILTMWNETGKQFLLWFIFLWLIIWTHAMLQLLCKEQCRSLRVPHAKLVFIPVRYTWWRIIERQQQANLTLTHLFSVCVHLSYLCVYLMLLHANTVNRDRNRQSIQQLRSHSVCWMCRKEPYDNFIFVCWWHHFSCVKPSTFIQHLHKRDKVWRQLSWLNGAHKSLK